MVTFEDFFAKKKIDLQVLKKEEPELYAEFQVHYYAMGEKSFDHTKKFWFNKLRKSYKLNEEDAPVQKTEATTSGQSVVESPEVNKALGFKPKFKAVIPKPEEQEKQENIVHDELTVLEPENKPTGFKPRFKAGVTKTEDKNTESPQAGVSPEDTAPKPVGFKPRFKAGVTKPVAKEEEPDSTVVNEPTVPEPENKPTGFKPRFKAGVTKTEDKNTELSQAGASPEDTAPKPVGFKPRFKAGMTKSVSKEEESDAVIDKEQTTSEQANKPSGFKPRFKAGVTKINKTDQDSSDQ